MIPAQSPGVSEASAGLGSWGGTGAFVSLLQVKEKLFSPFPRQNPKNDRMENQAGAHRERKTLVSLLFQAKQKVHHAVSVGPTGRSVVKSFAGVWLVAGCV